jgi:hypothetical protein
VSNADATREHNGVYSNADARPQRFFFTFVVAKQEDGPGRNGPQLFLSLA